jgi:hypothetical protein
MPAVVEQAVVWTTDFKIGVSNHAAYSAKRKKLRLAWLS